MSWRAGMEHFHHVRLGQQRAQRREVDACRLRVDHRDLLLPGQLHQAQFG